jgi:hypothetical protein
MKRLLVLLMMFGIMAGMLGIVGADPSQGIGFEVNPQTTVTINPPTLEFGLIVPGAAATTATNGPISFNAAGSNTDISIEFTSVDKTIFNSIELETSPGVWVYISTVPTITMPCNKGIDDVCNYSPNPKTVAARLAVPIGTSAGTKTGSITYTITGTTPV